MPRKPKVPTTPTVFDQLDKRLAKPPVNRDRQPGALPETREVKFALIKAFYELGGIPALVEWGTKQPAEFYKLWARILPHEIRTNLAQAAKVQQSNVQIEFVRRDGVEGTRVTVGSTGETGRAEIADQPAAALLSPAPNPIQEVIPEPVPVVVDGSD